jgi:V/A-type H+-transporting ATPase subunit B
MSDGIGAGRTRDDHPDVARQLYAACARAERARSLEAIIGRDELSPAEQQYLSFGDRFERDLLRQGPQDRRPIEETLRRAWRLLAQLPASELTRLPAHLVEKYGEGSLAPAARSGAPAS